MPRALSFENDILRSNAAIIKPIIFQGQCFSCIAMQSRLSVSGTAAGMCLISGVTL